MVPTTTPQALPPIVSTEKDKDEGEKDKDEGEDDKDEDEDEDEEDKEDAAFRAAVKQRDSFSGRPHCVACGEVPECVLQHCYIIPKKECNEWKEHQEFGWLPDDANSRADLEPRNALLMCANHRRMFELDVFFIRVDPESQKYVLVNYGDWPSLRAFHGKAVSLHIRDPQAPFPALFIIHECRVRGRLPFRPTSPHIPDDVQWQDWITSHDAVDSVSGTALRLRAITPRSQLPSGRGGADVRGRMDGVDEVVPRLSRDVVAVRLLRT
ncbi:hypothetical protein LXA43DRAFT_1099599 [Ganoderma leucocontextum]|nr:hypothetical protein LXA43DRAFT_1099599 [Ganoderma leucocontextum]